MWYYYLEDNGMWIVTLIAAIWAMIASARVNSTFKKYSTFINTRGLTGAECAMAVLRSAGIYDV